MCLHREYFISELLVAKPIFRMAFFFSSCLPIAPNLFMKLLIRLTLYEVIMGSVAHTKAEIIERSNHYVTSVALLLPFDNHHSEFSMKVDNTNFDFPHLGCVGDGMCRP